MIDFLEEYFLGIFIVLVFLGVGVAAYYSEQEANAWVEACVADGVKRYRCEERWSTAHPPAPQTNVTVHSGH